MRIDMLDRSVDYQHFSRVAPAYAKVRTPDWLVYLLTRDLGFKALITSDHSQLEQDEELVALATSKISLITWKGRQEDPVVLWGQLLAYMPQVLPLIAVPQTVVRLPNPRLTPKDHIFKAPELISARSVRDRLSYPERRDAALKMMQRELTRRGREDLGKYLVTTTRRPKAPAESPTAD
jgi:hypothetical protein